MAGIYFHGRQIVKPGAAIHINAEDLIRSSTAAIDIIAIIGEARGGEPNVVHKFTDPATARQVLKDGDLLTGMEILYSPAADSNKFPGAHKVTAIRVNPATKATKNLKDTGAADVISLTSKDWGLDQNQIRYKVEVGTTDAKFEGVLGKKLTINDYLNDVYEIGDNLGPIFKIKYTGNASTALAKFNSTTGAFAVTLAGNQSDGSVDIAADTTKDAFNNAVKLVNYINTFAPFYTASILGANDFPLSGLDNQTGFTCKGVYYVHASTLKSVVYFVNQNSQLVDAVDISSAVNPLVNVSWVFLAAGSEGTTTTAHWQAALDLLLGEKVSIVISACTADSIRDYVRQITKSHVDYARGISKFRTGVTGTSLADEADIEDIKNITRGLNSSSMVCATPGIQRYDRTGTLANLESVFTGCCMAGMAIGSPDEPITFDYINAQGLTKIYTETEIDDLLQSGAAPVEVVEDEGFRIVQGLTTYLQEDNPFYKEWWMQRNADVVSADLIVALEKSFVGKGGTMQRILNVKSIINTKCGNYISDGMIFTYDPDSITVLFQDQWVKSTVKVSFTDPINWITLELNAVPVRVSI